MSLVTTLARPGLQAPALEQLADSSSLVTPRNETSPASRNLDSPPATPARAGHFPTPESSRDFPDVAASASGSPLCSHDDTKAPRSIAGVYDDVDRERRTDCNGSICAVRRGACCAPSLVTLPATTLSLITLQPSSAGRKSIRPKKNFSWGRVGRKPTKENMRIKPPEEDEFHPATPITAASANTRSVGSSPLPLSIILGYGECRFRSRFSSRVRSEHRLSAPRHPRLLE